jgi:hypothetical protein
VTPQVQPALGTGCRILTSVASRYVSAGYFLTKSFACPPYLSSEGLLPPRLLSLSGCLAAFAPDIWAYDWIEVSDESRVAAATKLGISKDVVMQLANARREFDDVAYPRVFRTRDAALRFLERLPPSPDWSLLGVGLEEQYVPGFLAEQAIDQVQGRAPVANRRVRVRHV